MKSKDAQKIARYPEFTKRVGFFLIRQAVDVLSSAAPDAGDTRLAKTILEGGAPVDVWSLAVVGVPAILSGNHDVDGKDISDADIENAVAVLWAVFKK
jgi:hypothetical protein